MSEDFKPEKDPTPDKKIAKRTIYTVLSVVLAVFSASLLGFAVYKHYNPSTVAIPTIQEPYEVEPSSSEITGKPVIPGADTGWGSDGKKVDEQGRPTVDANGNPIKYDVNGAPYRVDANGNPVDANGKPLHVNENGNPVDEKGNKVKYDQHGTPYSVDAEGNPIDSNGNRMPVDANGNPVAPEQGATTNNPSNPQKTSENKTEQPASENGGQGSPAPIDYPLAEGYEQTAPDPNTGAPQVKGPQVKVPGFGSEEEGIEGVLTDTQQETRSSDGDPVSKQMQEVCPNMTAGSMCIPSQKKVIYYHNVGVRESTTGSGLVMAVPSTQTAGWLNNSAPLGADKGVSIFAAHVIFKGGVPGPFYDLNQLKAGDDIIMRDMNGKNYTYRINRAQVTETTELPDEVYNYTSGPHQLALVTCTGAYFDGRYENRLIMWAVPVR